jgi:protein NirF
MPDATPGDAGADSDARRAAAPLAVVKHLHGEGFTVVDAARHERLGTVGVGRQPHTLAVHPGGRWGYVPYMASNDLEVVDLWTLSVVDRLAAEAGTAPVGAALSNTGEYLFVSCYGALPGTDTPGLAVFETGGGSDLALVDELPVGQAGGVVVDPANDVWVALKSEDAVVRLSGDAPFGERDRFAVPGRPQDLAYAPGYGLLAANSAAGDSVTFFDALAGARLATVPAPNPRGGTAVPAADRWVVGNTDGDGVTAIDLAAVRDGASDAADAATRVPLGTPTAFTDARPDGRLLAVDAYEDDRVAFLDPASLDVAARVRTGGTPHHPRFSADGSTCYVPNEDDDTVTVLDTSGPVADGDADVTHVTDVPVPEGAAPSGCYRTDRRR